MKKVQKERIKANKKKRDKRGGGRGEDSKGEEQGEEVEKA